ncbi:MAG: hypothetical protein WCS90_06290 [Bacilli bacterium]
MGKEAYRKDEKRWLPDGHYSDWLKGLKKKYRTAQIKVVAQVNYAFIIFLGNRGKILLRNTLQRNSVQLSSMGLAKTFNIP